MKWYRHFKINTPGPNDFEMMKELLTKRFERIDKDEEPDLIVIDGGKGQLGMACQVLKENNLEHIPIIGLAKEFEEIYIPNIWKWNSAWKMTEQINIWSYRWKITESSLDNIPGIGQNRKKYILKELGSIDKVKEASIDQLANIKSMNKKVAENVYNYYHNEEMKLNE